MHVSRAILAGALTISTAFAGTPAQAGSQSDAGAVIGAIIGGVIGHDRGDGDAGSTIIGAIIGGAIGAVVGNELDEADRRAVSEARARALRDGGYADWDGARYRSRTGARGRVIVLRDGYYAGDMSRRCREYSSEIHVRGRVERTTSQACVDRYGNWSEVTSTQVIYGRNPVGGGYGGRDPGRRPMPYPGGDHGRPGRSHWEVPDSEVMSVVMEVRAMRWDSDRLEVLETYVNYWQRRGNRISSYRLADILRAFTYDSDRLRATRVLRSVMNVEISDVQRALQTFRFASDREEARRILLY